MRNDTHDGGQQHGPEIQAVIAVEGEKDQDNQLDGVIPCDGSEYDHARLDSQVVTAVPMQESLRRGRQGIDHGQNEETEGGLTGEEAGFRRKIDVAAAVESASHPIYHHRSPELLTQRRIME